MRTTDHLRRGDRSSESSSFSCQHYTPRPDSKRCKDYQKGGKCARPDMFRCSEWEKRNRTPAVPTDLFGDPAPELIQSRNKAKARKPKSTRATQRPAAASFSSAPVQPKDADGVLPLVRNVTDEDVASFRALGVEVCIGSDQVGDIWLVPEYQDESRKELRVDHAMTLSLVCSAFPGAKIVSFEKIPQQGKETV